MTLQTTSLRGDEPGDPSTPVNLPPLGQNLKRPSENHDVGHWHVRCVPHHTKRLGIVNRTGRGLGCTMHTGRRAGNKVPLFGR
jgi:hypothetical protein